jgi:outer membrane receptor protein involved in Fe transport
MSTKNLHLGTIAALGVLAASVCFSQTATPGQTATQDDKLEEIVVTATSIERRPIDTPQAVEQLNAADLQRLTSNSQADILSVIPGLKAEGGGGEVLVNVLPRGLPATGQYQFTPLEYDGIPAFSSNGLNSTAFDAYERNDLGIERFEYVNGGVSNLFGAGSVAGILNYVSTTGTQDTSGIIQTEFSNDNRFRTDIAVSGPLSASDFVALSGFYRYDEGPLYSNMPNNGGQLRANWKHELPDDGGTVIVYGQVIDDSAQFYGDIPLSQGSHDLVRGNDGRLVYTTNSEETEGLTSVTPYGRVQSGAGDGISAHGGLFAIAFDRDLGDDWKLALKSKYAKYDTTSNLQFGGDNIFNAPETQAQYLNDLGRGPNNTSLLLPGESLQNAHFTFADNGQSVPANYLVYGNGVQTRIRPATDFTFEAAASRKFKLADVDNALTLGIYAARAKAGDFDYTQFYLGDFENNPRLINLTISDPGGVTRTVTTNGLANTAGYRNWEQSAIHEAFYAANQMDAGNWSLDYGARVERYLGNIAREGTSVYTVDNGPAADATHVDEPLLDSVTWGNGSWQFGKVSTTSWAAAIASMYKINDQVRVYGNLNRGYYFPELRDVGFNPVTGVPESYQAEEIRQAELGLKFKAGDLTGTVATFGNELKNRRSVNTDLVGDEIVTTQSNQSIGEYLEARYMIVRHLFVEGNITHQKQKVTATSDPIGTPVGSETIQEPDTLANLGLTYDDGRFDGWLMESYDSRAWADSQNTVPLSAYSVVRLGAGYTLHFSGSQSFRVSFDVYNLLDSQGVTEGSVHLGPISNPDVGNYFMGRQILPRRFLLRLGYKF